MGDALGAPIEFWSLSEIRSRFGPGGVTGYVGGSGAVTDDTQMALFTAEGLIRASVQQRPGGAADRNDMVHQAYLRWLHTQGYDWSRIAAPFPERPSPTGGLWPTRGSTSAAPRATPAYPAQLRLRPVLSTAESMIRRVAAG